MEPMQAISANLYSNMRSAWSTNQRPRLNNRSITHPSAICHVVCDCNLDKQFRYFPEKCDENKMDPITKDEGLLVLGTPSYIILSVLLCATIYYLMQIHRKMKMLDRIPGPKTVPLLGNALQFNLAPEDVSPAIEDVCSEFAESRLLRLWLGYRGFVFVFTPEGAEVILSSQKHITKSREYNYLHPWMGTGLLTSTGTKWHSRRKALTPSFHFKILEDFIEVFNEQSATLSSKLSKYANGKEFDIFPFITHCALDIIHETALGVSINAQDFSDSEYVKAVYRIGTLVQMRQLRPWLQIDILYSLSGLAKEERQCLDILHKQSFSVIDKRRQQLSNEISKTSQEDSDVGVKKRLAFLDLLLAHSEDGKSLTNDDIREEVDTFMFEGHDTTAAGIAFSTYLLAVNPEAQKLVHEEMDAIFGDDVNRPATIDEVRQMKYLECCIKEALRLYPSVPMLGRDLKEDVVIEGYTVPSGTSAVILPYILHRNPKSFPDPEAFKPDRFTRENCQNRHPYAYVPFSAGPRNCIGQKFALMEEKVVLSSMFRKFRVESTLKRQDMKVVTELILRPHDGLKVKLFPRK